MNKKPVIVEDELESILREATASVEQELNLEDEGWQNLSGGSGEIVSSDARKNNLLYSRLYYTKDPLAKQAIRLWTDYTFGTGMTWSCDDEGTNKVLEDFWYSKDNQSVLSARGQRLSSDKLLVDGEIFFAIFLGETSTIRCIDPLEITEIITDVDDMATVLYYKRNWTDNQGKSYRAFYRSASNIKGKPGTDMYGVSVTTKEDALIYHLTYNTISQRGNPLLLPALDWIKQYRRFLASRVAVMLSLARFAWRTKVKGGQTAVTTVKGKLHEQTPNAGSILLENMGSDTTPIKTESGASSAYQDGRMIKLQIAAAVGIPEQYFGDISIGNLATAKTVELPMMKMFQSYQQVWNDTYRDIDEIILEHAGIKPDKWYVDRDFPKIAPEDVAMAAVALGQILTVMPDLAYSEDVKQIAMMTLGVNDPAQALKAINQESKKNPEIALTRALKRFQESIKGI